MEIVKIIDENNSHYKKIIEWNHNWWGHPRGRELREVEAFMNNMLCEDRVPQTYAVLIDGSVVGSYQLGMFDGLTIRPDLYPWLLNVYVDEKHRGKGICALIAEHSKKTIKDLGYSELYLHTQHVGLYEKYGWEFLGEVESFRKNKDETHERLYIVKV